MVENEMKQVLISVVIPAFRSGPLIREAIDSVNSQTFRDFEIVVVDNNASEETRLEIQKAVKEYPKTIRVVHEPTQGNSSARNKGIQESRGHYIALLDDDDKMYPQRLAQQLKAILDNPDASIVHGRIDYVAYDGISIVNANQTNDIQDWSKILLGDLPRFSTDPLRSILPSVSLFSRKLALEVGAFDERFNPFWVEDTEFSLRMWEHGPFFEVPHPLVAFRLPSKEFLKEKRTGVSSWIQARRNMNLFFSILVTKYYVLGNPDIENRFKRIRSQWLREVAQDILRVRDGRKFSRSLLKRALRDQPNDYKNWKWYFRSFFPEKFLSSSLGSEGFYDGNINDYIDQDFLEFFLTIPEEKSE